MKEKRWRDRVSGRIGARKEVLDFTNLSQEVVSRGEEIDPQHLKGREGRNTARWIKKKRERKRKSS